jgi:hypothetical protein
MPASDENKAVELAATNDAAAPPKRCLIILVHGTWGRGFFPKCREVSLYPPNKRWWFEEGSPFRTRLDAALKNASLDWSVRPFLWSGANSVNARNSAAKELSVCLRKDLEDHPDATAIIIAHSHGGNVALRALQYLDYPIVNRTRVVSLATPFLRVFAREPSLSTVVKLLLWGAVTFFVMPIFLAIVVIGNIASNWMPEWSVFIFVGVSWMILMPVTALFVTRWLIAFFTDHRAALAIEEAANYNTRGAAAPRVFVIRGVDDEASLSLAAGSIGARLSYFVLDTAIPAIWLILPFIIFPMLVFGLKSPVIQFIYLGVIVLGMVIFLVLPGVFKSVFGREFLASGMVCDIAVDSVPDTLGSVKAITLRPVEASTPKSDLTFRWGFGFVSLTTPYPERPGSLRRRLSWWVQTLKAMKRAHRQLRHGIYNHPACVDEIVRWIC